VEVGNHDGRDLYLGAQATSVTMRYSQTSEFQIEEKPIRALRLDWNVLRYNMTTILFF